MRGWVRREQEKEEENGGRWRSRWREGGVEMLGVDGRERGREIEEKEVGMG